MDWIETFLEYTEGTPAPDIFRLWSAISCVAGSLERRVWVDTARSSLYPNMFIVLVGSPGIGKTQAITPVEELWFKVGKFKVAPNNVTKASLIDSLVKADHKMVLGGGKGLLEYHSLLVPASEFGVLVPAHDLEFLSVLNYIYDNPHHYSEERRTNKLSIEISYPQLNILAGSQPGFLATLLPEEAWSMGFTSRIILVYSGTTPYVSLFGKQEKRETHSKELLMGLNRMAGMYGPMDWAPEASAEMEAWAKGGCQPVPEHSKLTHYVPRRAIHTIKLATISAASRGEAMTIELEDVERARTWLLTAERAMPDIFREMVGRSDSQVIQELHFHLWKIWLKDQKPIHESRVFHFLQAQVPSEKIGRVLEAAERSGILMRHAGTPYWSPRAKSDWGME